MISLSSVSFAATCSLETVASFRSKIATWKGKKIIATASWCSSCKETLKQAAKEPEKYVFLVAFDTPKAVEEVLDTFKVQSSCIYGDAVVQHLKIDSVPWSKGL
jgi:thiol-disulfide isomerase/thioredoxin